MTPNPTLDKRKKLTKRQLNGLIQLRLGKIQGRNIESIEEVVKTINHYDKHLAHEMIDTVISRMIKLRCDII